MIARMIPCRIESCGECSYWDYPSHGCSHPDWPRIDPFVRDPGSIPPDCPLPYAEDDDGDD